MRLFYCFILGILLSSGLNNNSFAKDNYSLPSNINVNKYEAIVIGRITSKEVKKTFDYYYTEYKLKPINWLYKKQYIPKTKYITLNILGAELPDKGIIIKSSTAPDYIPINTEAVFLLEKTLKKEKNIFTLSKNGVINK